MKTLKLLSIGAVIWLGICGAAVGLYLSGERTIDRDDCIVTKPKNKAGDTEFLCRDHHFYILSRAGDFRRS